MGACDIIHRKFAPVRHQLFVNVILPVLLLEQRIAGVLFVGQEVPNAVRAPRSAEGTFTPSVVQIAADGTQALAAVEAREYLTDNGGFFLIHLNTICGNAVAEQESQVDKLSVLKCFTDAPFLVFTGRQAFFLCIGCQDGQHQLSVRAHGVEVLFFKEHINTQAFQFPDGFQQRDRISCKAGDAFCNDEVDFSGAAACQHSLKAVPLALGAGDGFVTEHATVKPTGVRLNQAVVIAHLRGKRVEHRVLSGRNAGIGADAQRLRLHGDLEIDPFYDSLHVVHLPLVCDILPLNARFIQPFQRNILHEDIPYFLAMIVSISAYSSSEIKPFESIRRASAIAAW